MNDESTLPKDYYREKLKRWDTYFHSICEAVSTKSPCHSRKIGAILVRDNSIISTGFNGPARGYPHCEPPCPRKKMGFKSGEGLVHCPAAHAETNCIANAARIGASTIGSTLYMNCIVPCKDCIVLLVNAGIVEIVIDKIEPYHIKSLNIAKVCNIKLREFIL
jgi:dCMP deaminase